MLSPDHLAYKILHKVANHHEKQPTVKLIFIETVDEIKLSEMTYRLFLKSLEVQGYLKIWAENKSDWGQIIISPYGIQFVNEFPDSENSERDYENLSAYLDKLVKKEIKDLIRAKKSAEIHLQKQTEMMEYQRGLATNGKPNCYSTYLRQVDTAKLELQTIDEELETRKIFGKETVDSTKDATVKETTQNKPLTRDEEKQRDHDKWIDKNFTFRNTLLDFNRLMLATKKAKPQNEYILELLKWQDLYGNSTHCYSIWGPDYLHTNHSDIYKQITDEIDRINGSEQDRTQLISANQFDEDTVFNAGIIETKPLVQLTIDSIQNNFDNISIIEVHNHFYNGLVKHKYISESDLLLYLNTAFALKKAPDALFRLKNVPSKQKIMKVFYDYYKDVAGKPHGKQRLYAALLGDYFEGYSTNTVSTNFNK